MSIIWKSAATTYYVKHPDNGWWGYFTVNESLGLLQVFCDLGTFTDNFADRWSAPGPDFKAFLMEGSVSYFANAIETTAAQYDDRAAWRKSVQRRLHQMMVYLWPLFIEELREERSQPTETTTEEGDNGE